MTCSFFSLQVPAPQVFAEPWEQSCSAGWRDGEPKSPSLLRGEDLRKQEHFTSCRTRRLHRLAHHASLESGSCCLHLKWSWLAGRDHTASCTALMRVQTDTQPPSVRTEAHTASFLIFAKKDRRLKREQRDKESNSKEAAEMSCGIFSNMRPPLSTAQQDMKSNLHFTSLTICQHKELVLSSLFCCCCFFYLGSTLLPKVTSPRLQDLPPGRGTCRDAMGYKSLKNVVTY